MADTKLCHLFQVGNGTSGPMLMAGCAAAVKALLGRGTYWQLGILSDKLCRRVVLILIVFGLLILLVVAPAPATAKKESFKNLTFFIF